jgi:DNA polymerase III epsilon subunit-like protein
MYSPHQWYQLMPNLQKICVFDLETDGADPEICSPVQIASLIVDPIKLEIIENSEFNVFLKPEKLSIDEQYSYSDSDVLEFHAKVKSCSKEEVLDSWKEYPDQKIGWQRFTEYLEMYHVRAKSKKSCFSAPIAAGYNINRFDMKIINRLSQKYNNVNKEGSTSLFYPRDVVDIMNVIFYWFEGNNELKNYTLDNVRDYLGIPKEGSHDALKDVRDTAEIMVRFLKLHRNLGKKVKFKGSFLNASA